ncbi:hypothetical protein NX794_05780 [Streptomyces sp. LP11]|uniref:Uncharacterized protein n=1 Tax=Streptomyces pyxinicus TaxID=2970331 RepID=A0ABT2AWX2_9ACTN|nr:hypothetical protein [Streptomyces sp. LP11]MCS0600741.1 hypothetical protein [Streptomyces sp. LP11]
MDIANQLALIDRLCAREFPAERGRTDVGTGGPGYLTAELLHSGDPGEADAADREETEAQYEADRDALAERLSERWGPPQHFSLYSVLERLTVGDAVVAEPWGTLSGHVPDVQLWHIPGAGRWFALGVSRWGGEPPYRLLAVVTETDPV